MATNSRAQWHQIVIGYRGPRAPRATSTSWWLNLDRQQFSDAVRAETARMSSSGRAFNWSKQHDDTIDE